MKSWILLVAFAVAGYAQLLPKDVPATGGLSGAAGGEIKPDTVVAVIAGVSVTAADVSKLMKYAPPNLVNIFKQNPQQALGTAFQMKYLSDQAVEQHLDQQDPTKETLEAVLNWQKENILAGAMVNEINNGFKVTEDQINEVYKTHQSRYEEAKIKIILIGFKPSALSNNDDKPGESIDDKLKRKAQEAVESENVLNNRSEEDARKLAEDIVKQLRAGSDFVALVAKYSDDKESKASGGDFGTPIKATSSFAPELKKVVFDLKKGEVSEPLRQANSYYIIRLEDKTVEPMNGDVTASIVKELRDTHMNQTLNDLNKRFTPQVLRPDFFIQAQKAASGN
jgi:parvulin-like peptidyl-prolyl isomerase